MLQISAEKEQSGSQCTSYASGICLKNKIYFNKKSLAGLSYQIIPPVITHKINKKRFDIL